MKRIVIKLVSFFLITLIIGLEVVYAVEFTDMYRQDWIKTTDLEISYNSITSVSDGYVVVGESNLNALIVKYSPTGSVVWRHEEAGNLYSTYTSIANTGDGFIVVGSSSSTTSVWGNNGFDDAIIVKYNLDGTIAWSHNAGGTHLDRFNSVIVIDDGYIAVGYSRSTDAIWGNNGSDDAIIVKYDLDGTVVWSFNAGGSGYEEYSSVSSTSDGYIAVGYSTSTDTIWGNNGGTDAVIVKYDLDGTVLWSHNVGGSGYDQYTSVVSTDNAYIIVGYSDSSNAIWGNNGGTDAVIVKYNLNGSIAWYHNEGSSDEDSYSTITADELGYTVVGLSWSKDAIWGNHIEGVSDTDAIIVRYDFNGTVITSHSYGNSYNEAFKSVKLVGDSIITVGETFNSFKSINPMGLILKYTLKDGIVKNVENPQTGISSVYIVLTVASIGIISFLILSKKKNLFAKI